MVESLAAPDEAFDWVFMLRPEDWPLLEKLWQERPPDWREALAYVLVDGPVAHAQPILRHALGDENPNVASQAAISLCHQFLEYPDKAPFDTSTLPRLRELRQTIVGDMQEVETVL